MDYSRYPENWKDISLAIRERAKWACEWCGAFNGHPHPRTGSKVILTVHHIGIDKPDGTPGDRNDKMDVRPENLAALCQSCHWKADWDIHYAKAVIARRARRRQRLKDAGQLPLWED